MFYYRPGEFLAKNWSSTRWMMYYLADYSIRWYGQRRHDIASRKTMRIDSLYDTIVIAEITKTAHTSHSRSNTHEAEERARRQDAYLRDLTSGDGPFSDDSLRQQEQLCNEGRSRE